jgi:hypothetical protein
MKFFNTLLILFYIYFAISCSSIYSVSYDYDRKVDFIKLLSYRWLPVPEKADISSLDVNRIKKAVNNELNTRGLRMRLDNPDFLIAEHLIKKDNVDITNWGYGYGLYRRNRGYHDITVYQYEEVTLILDFIDAKSKSLIWRGTAKTGLENARTPEKRDLLINDAVQKILHNFPPLKGE